MSVKSLLITPFLVYNETDTTEVRYPVMGMVNLDKKMPYASLLSIA